MTEGERERERKREREKERERERKKERENFFFKYNKWHTSSKQSKWKQWKIPFISNIKFHLKLKLKTLHIRLKTNKIQTINDVQYTHLEYQLFQLKYDTLVHHIVHHFHRDFLTHTLNMQNIWCIFQLLL